MTVLGDLDRTIAMAEAARGNYLLFSTETEDEKAVKVFKDMAADMQRHVKILESRRSYLAQHNQLSQNDTQQGQEGGQEGQQQQKQ